MVDSPRQRILALPDERSALTGYRRIRPIQSAERLKSAAGRAGDDDIRVLDSALDSEPA